MLHDVSARCRMGLVVFALVVIAGGCQKSNRLPVYPVKGQVLYNGKPLKGVSLAFHPVDPKNDIGYPAHAKTDDDGRFLLTSYVENDGAPAGEYKVAFAFEPESIDEGADQQKPIAFQLPDKYLRKETTDITVTIQKGANDLEPFRLTGPELPTKR